MARKTPNTFKAMTPAQLREYIDGCHRARSYDEQFTAACKELNGRTAQLTIPTTQGPRTLDGRALVLPGYESFALVIHRAIENRQKYTVTEETTGLSLCQDFERCTSQARTVAALVARFERYSMTPEKLQATIETHKKHAARVAKWGKK